MAAVSAQYMLWRIFKQETTKQAATAIYRIAKTPLTHGILNKPDIPPG